MSAPLRRIGLPIGVRWWRVFYEKRIASQRLFVTLSPMTASTSGRFLWRNRINGRDGEGSVLKAANNFRSIRQSEFFIRKAEGRRQKAEGRSAPPSGSVCDVGDGSAAAPPHFCLLPSAFYLPLLSSRRQFPPGRIA